MELMMFVCLPTLLFLAWLWWIQGQNVKDAEKGIYHYVRDDNNDAEWFYHEGDDF